MDTATLSFAEFVVILQAILPYDLFPPANRLFCLDFRNRHDDDLYIGEFINFLTAALRRFPERESIFDRLIGQLAMRKIATYDEVAHLVTGR